MARRKQSFAEDLVGMVSKLPWWVGVGLAVISYVALHSYAGKDIKTSDQDLNQVMTGGMLNGLALIAQYILPAIFGIGAVISFINQLKSKKLYGDVATAKTKLDDISWQEFEVLTGEHFRQQGYQVEDTGSGADGGVDLVLRKNGEKYLVQCKHWKAYKVGVKLVRELLGVMVGKGATGGIMVTSGEFTIDAKKFASENNIQMINGNVLNSIVAKSKRITDPRTTPTGSQPKKNADVM